MEQIDIRYHLVSTYIIQGKTAEEAIQEAQKAYEWVVGVQPGAAQAEPSLAVDRIASKNYLDAATNALETAQRMVGVLDGVQRGPSLDAGLGKPNKSVAVEMRTCPYCQPFGPAPKGL